jgi:leucyl aminopeptidase
MKKIISSSLLCMAFATQAADHSQLMQKNIGEDQQYWITIGQDAVRDLERVGAKEFLLPSAVATPNSKAISVAQISEKQLNNLSRLMHDNHKRCGGYIVHKSLQSALTEQQQGLVPSNFEQSALNQGDVLEGLLPNLNKDNIVDTIQYLATSFNNRYYTTSGGVASSNGLKDRWAGIIAGKSYASVSQFGHSWAQSSVIVDIVGSERPDEVVIIGGHLDSTIGSTGENAIAPGADDDASGIATLTEVMRVFLQNGQPKRSIRFMAYAAEEVGLRGSKAIAENYAANNVNVVGALQLDMTNYKGSTQDIVFMDDFTSASQNTYLTNILDTYMPNVNYAYDSCGYACSDHASWTNNGFPASMPFEAKFSGSNPNIHSSRDTLANMDSSGAHALNFAKMGLAYAIELANADAPPPPAEKILENNVPVSGLSASAGSDIVYTMDVPADATAISFASSGGTGDADLYVKFGSAPTDGVYDCRPYASGNNESCPVTNAGGKYYVRLKAYSTFSGVTLTGAYTAGGGGLPDITDSKSNISVGTGAWAHYTQDIPAGYGTLTVTMSGGSGDADLYVRHGSESTTSTYDCRPYKNGNAEVCTINNPAAGTFYIDVRGYSAASGVNLTWTATE